MLFKQIYDDKLAQYAYLIGCQRTGEAILFDPLRDVDRYVDIARLEGLRVVAAAETHIHADFASGARELAARFGARVYLSAAGGPDWQYEWARTDDCDHRPLAHGDRFAVGDVRFEALHTPGHTPEHMCFLVSAGGGCDAGPMGVLSGDFVFVGDVGRPDLLETAAGRSGAMRPAALQLRASLARFLELPDHAQVWPGHGAGSACGKALGAVPQSTVGYERRANPALLAAAEGEGAFLAHVLDGQPEPPMYFARMKRLNQQGPPVLGPLPDPPRIEASGVAAVAVAAASGEGVVLDARADRSAFMARHLPGSLYVPRTKSFCTAAGSVVPDPEAPLTLVAPESEVAGAVRDLARIGIDGVTGYVVPETLDSYFAAGGAAGRIPELDFAAAGRALARNGGAVVDVRYASEYGASHVLGAVNASYTRLPDYRERLPDEGPLFVHCLSGARAAVAASWLAREGHDARYINDLYADPQADPHT